jgi:hypothetical protein
MDSGAMRLPETSLSFGVMDLLRNIEGNSARGICNQYQTGKPFARQFHPGNAPQLLDFLECALPFGGAHATFFGVIAE